VRVSQQGPHGGHGLTRQDERRDAEPPSPRKQERGGMEQKEKGGATVAGPRHRAQTGKGRLYLSIWAR